MKKVQRSQKAVCTPREGPQILPYPWSWLHAPAHRKGHGKKEEHGKHMFHTLERPHVVVGFRTLLSSGKIPGKALCCRDRHGWFLAWPPCHDKRKWPSSSKNWKMVILHFRTGTWILRPESMSVTCNSHFVGLPLLQVRQSPCFDDLTEKIAQKRKTQKTNSPLEQGLTHTHTQFQWLEPNIPKRPQEF